MFQGRVIGAENEGLMHQVILPMVEEAYDGVELSFSGAVDCLMFFELVGTVGDNTLVAILLLAKDTTSGVVFEAPIGVKNERVG